MSRSRYSDGLRLERVAEKSWERNYEARRAVSIKNFEFVGLGMLVSLRRHCSRGAR